ncbi:MAG: T9SS type A sorting domain-containing protein [Bacteroidales bacterium]|nr:T9SS type A sorting domain-containing protein [Bacteroidales bacterium]
MNLIIKNIKSELTLSQLHVDNTEIELLAGSSETLMVTAKFVDGHFEEVTQKASYENSNPKVDTITEGEADITITYQGDLGEAQSVTIHVNVSVGAGVWLEAECGTVGSLWNINTNNTASNGKYVTIQSGNNSTDAAPSYASGQLSYTFDLPASDTYTLYLRVICPSPDDDSFWLSMDGGSFAMWNGITGSSSWTWTYFPTTYQLSTETHTLTIDYREDGARLDKIWITNAGADITNEGADARNCNTALRDDIVQDMEVFPNPVKHELNILLSHVPADIRIFSSDGKEVFFQHANSLITCIDMAHYHPGLYFIKSNIQGQTLVRKIFKD